MIQILPGRAGYPGTTQNVIRSADYPHAWDGSFAVLSAEDFDGGAYPGIVPPRRSLFRLTTQRLRQNWMLFARRQQLLGSHPKSGVGRKPMAHEQHSVPV